MREFFLEILGRTAVKMLLSFRKILGNIKIIWKNFKKIFKKLLNYFKENFLKNRKIPQKKIKFVCFFLWILRFLPHFFYSFLILPVERQPRSKFSQLAASAHFAFRLPVFEFGRTQFSFYDFALISPLLL